MVRLNFDVKVWVSEKRNQDSIDVLGFTGFEVIVSPFTIFNLVFLRDSIQKLRDRANMLSLSDQTELRGSIAIVAEHTNMK